jgi:hypothetical protein
MWLVICTLHNINRMSVVMKHQDQYQYDPKFTAPYTIFKKIGNNTFFVNSSSILATQKLITVGEDFVLIDNTKDNGSKIREVKLVDSYYRNGIVHLIVRDFRTQRVFTLDHCIEYPESDNCPWVLANMHYFKDRENFKAIKSYCDCDTYSKNKGNPEVSHISNHENNLLDFDF